MAKGDKPIMTISARRKDAPKGDRSHTVKLASAWHGRFPGSFDVALSTGVREVVMMDGTVIRPADYWLTLKDWREDDRGRRGGSSKAEPGTGTPSGSSDDVPFRAPPRPAKDLS